MPACLIPHRSCRLHPRHIISQEQHGVCIINTLFFFLFLLCIHIFLSIGFVFISCVFGFLPSFFTLSRLYLLHHLFDQRYRDGNVLDARRYSWMNYDLAFQ